ncbi:peptidyl-prolyl cis-trans isomerase [Vibrio pectenicida]|uniref:Peptidyl-prolyl cis-trans isomerase n=1 Tax=Vibrio pectenicida TaxID=62763 RepID=A0A3R9G2I7_9VIBR|nr:peptidylprolyl isomerase [Vibrio pectenicida]NOH72404.1 peptidyl-prolyl cis-trans isomerase [Vibrio pectenicida]RSD30788.1 peptidyl-prolyl cis-trans isomerase [Vibrio pectenicida]
MWKVIIASLALFSSLAFAGPKVVFETTLGAFTVELDEQKAPITVANFKKYVEDGSYVGTQFHRVIPGFMAQGGGLDKDMKAVPTYSPIKNEASNGLKNEVATIAMARTRNPNSATRQFFINYNNNEYLNFRNDEQNSSAGYAVFGKVTRGFETVKKMSEVPTTTKSNFQNVPETAIIITKATLIP